MNACYGHIFNERGGIKCVRCGHGYYEHSHVETNWYSDPNLPAPDRIKRSAIRLRYQPGEVTPSGQTYRSAYDRMMDRQPGVCDWYKLQAAKAVEEQADKIVDYANNPITAAVTEAMAAARIYRLPSPDLLVQRFGPFTPDNRTRP